MSKKHKSNKSSAKDKLEKQVEEEMSKKQKETSPDNQEDAEKNVQESESKADVETPEEVLDINRHNEGNLTYLYLFENDKKRWKFHKVTQARVLEVKFWSDEKKLPEKTKDENGKWKPWSSFKDYIAGLKGAAKDRLLEQTKKELNRSKEAQEDGETKSRLKRVVKILSK